MQIQTLRTQIHTIEHKYKGREQNKSALKTEVFLAVRGQCLTLLSFNILHQKKQKYKIGFGWFRFSFIIGWDNNEMLVSLKSKWYLYIYMVFEIRSIWTWSARHHHTKLQKICEFNKYNIQNHTSNVKFLSYYTNLYLFIS